MRRLFKHILVTACCLLIACVFVPLTIAAPTESGSLGGELGIGDLSDRYESLNHLGNSLTEEESVVIETRVGVLTSVNRALDDSEVRFTGEIVGDVVNAGPGHKWANASGAANTVISVYMPDDQAQLIRNTGSYHATGTTMRMTGIYHVACPEHQGELDVHTTSVEVLDAGGPITHLLERGRIPTALMLCFAATFMLVAYLAIRRYLRKRTVS